ncbi:hypothetical protein AAMO2058_000330600 [Amorphochlora amoebiformis]
MTESKSDVVRSRFSRQSRNATPSRKSPYSTRYNSDGKNTRSQTNRHSKGASMEMDSLGIHSSKSKPVEDEEKKDEYYEEGCCDDTCYWCSCWTKDDPENERLYEMVRKSRFMQQKLRGCRCVHWPQIAGILFFLMGSTFITLGIVFTLEIWQTTEAISRYDDCLECTCGDPTQSPSTFSPTTGAPFAGVSPSPSSLFPTQTVSPSIAPTASPTTQPTFTSAPTCSCPSPGTTTCEIEIKIIADMISPVYVYYTVEDFFQNHRQYVSSVSEAQLSGKVIDRNAAAGECTGASERDGLIIYPCGLKANSFFNDTFSAKYCPLGDLTNCRILNGTNWNKNNIAWPEDRGKIGRRDPVTGKETTTSIFNFTLPEVDDQDFIVWIRPGLSNHITKLYRVIEHQSLKKGDTLLVTVNNIFSMDPSTRRPTKHVIVANMSLLGGVGFFLVLVLLGSGSLAFSLMITCMVWPYICLRRKPGDLSIFRERRRKRLMKKRAKKRALMPRRDAEVDFEIDELREARKRRQKSIGMNNAEEDDLDDDDDKDNKGKNKWNFNPFNYLGGLIMNVGILLWRSVVPKEEKPEKKGVSAQERKEDDDDDHFSIPSQFRDEWERKSMDAGEEHPDHDSSGLPSISEDTGPRRRHQRRGYNYDDHIP